MVENTVALIVTKSGCPLYKEGDRVVFSGAAIDKEKSGNLCMTALAAVDPFVYAARKGTVRENALHCPDCAGGVEFMIRAEEPVPSSDEGGNKVG